MNPENLLLETIRETLRDVHIETGRADQFDEVCNRLEAAISAQILQHKIDYYTECLKA